MCGLATELFRKDKNYWLCSRQISYGSGGTPGLPGEVGRSLEQMSLQVLLIHFCLPCLLPLGAGHLGRGLRGMKRDQTLRVRATRVLPTPRPLPVITTTHKGNANRALPGTEFVHRCTLRAPGRRGPLLQPPPALFRPLRKTAGDFVP